MLTVSKPGHSWLRRERLNDQSIARAGQRAGAASSRTALHVDLLAAIKKARELFDDGRQDQRILYLVSDFRQADWSRPAAGDELLEAAERLKLGMHVKFVDVAHPPRREARRMPTLPRQPGHRPVCEPRDCGSRPATCRPTFTVTVANYSPSERQERPGRQVQRQRQRSRPSSVVPIPVDPARRPGRGRLPVLPRPARHQPDHRQPRRRKEDSGLLLDNTRYAIVEVRERVPILLDRRRPGRQQPRKAATSTYLQRAVRRQAAAWPRATTWCLASLADLERPDLDQYPSIYLVNVRELNDKALGRTWSSYVREGGSVAFFLGDRVNADFYNKRALSPTAPACSRCRWPPTPLPSSPTRTSSSGC